MQKRIYMEQKIGIRKGVDNLGRIVIPKEIRELLHFDEEIELILTEKGLLIRNPKYMVVRINKNDPPT